MLARLSPYAQSILRIVSAFTFSEHGWQKLFGFFGGLGGHGATAHFPALLWFAGALEAFGGLLFGLGLCTRAVAFVLCGEMAVAYFTQHAPRGLFPIRNGGEFAVLYCFIFLYFIAAGAGRWSLDHLRGKK
jgi:putative oxidoreductase